MYACVHVCSCVFKYGMHVQETLRDENWVLTLLQLELQKVGCHSVWELATKFLSPEEKQMILRTEPRPWP